MAEFTPSQKTAQDFNNGVEYVDYDAESGIMGDSVKAESINNVIEGLLYTQGLAVNQPDVSEANNVGTVNVSIIIYSDGTARLKFKNLKGNQGVGISTIVENGVDANGGNIYKITLEDGRTYNFVAPKGAKGDTGNGISTTVITYATSTSGTTAPTTGWQSTIPTVAQGSYLWTRTDNTYTDGATKTNYSVAYQGKDGESKGEPYATCGTAAATAAKSVAQTGFVLDAGARITIKFTYANTADSPTLNVNSTGAKAIKADGDTTYVKWLAGAVMNFVYDGTNWVCMAGYQLEGMRIGFIYTSDDPTSPATLYGGSWTAIGEGRSIVGYGITNNPSYKGNFSLTTQYYANDIVLRYGYGTYYVCKKDVLGQNVTQTEYWAVYEPGYQGGATSHTHESGSLYAKWGISTGSQEMHFVLKNADKTWTGYTRGISVTSKNDASWGEALDTGGSTAAGSSMPPYIVEYRWKRTA